MFYIYDANNVIFGNPKGYKSRSIAQRIATRYRHKLWATYDKRELKFSSANLFYAVRFVSE